MLTTKFSAVQPSQPTAIIKQDPKKDTLLAGCLANRFKVTVLSLQIATSVVAAVAAIVAGIFTSYILLALAAGIFLVSISSTILVSRMKITQNETKKVTDKAKEALQVQVQVKDPKHEQELQKRVEELSKNVEDLKKKNEDLKKSQLDNQQASANSQKDLSEQQLSEIIEKSEEKIIKLEALIKKLQEENNAFKQIPPPPIEQASPATTVQSPARAAVKRTETLIADVAKLSEENEKLKSQLNSIALPSESPKTLRINTLSLDLDKLSNENQELKKQLEDKESANNESPSHETLQRLNELSRNVATLEQENEELRKQLAEKQENSTNVLENIPPAPPEGGPAPPPPPPPASKKYTIKIPNKGSNSETTDKPKPSAKAGGPNMNDVLAASKLREEKAKAQKATIEGHKKTIEQQFSGVEKLSHELQKIKDFGVERGIVDFKQMLKDLRKEINASDATVADKKACIALLETIINSK